MPGATVPGVPGETKRPRASRAGAEPFEPITASVRASIDLLSLIIDSASPGVLLDSFRSPPLAVQAGARVGLHGEARAAHAAPEELARRRVLRQAGEHGLRARRLRCTSQRRVRSTWSTSQRGFWSTSQRGFRSTSRSRRPTELAGDLLAKQTSHLRHLSIVSLLCRLLRTTLNPKPLNP